ncbi:MAG: hypothetical protein H7176_08630 [Bdellovibrionales bacterium]|nr:hypothetical protein [Massilia sp.]
MFVILPRGYTILDVSFYKKAQAPSPHPMKNALLVLLMLLLPWQTISAAESNFTHIVNSQQETATFIKHFTEHVRLVMHHHDGADNDGPPHDDDSRQSARHLADFDHGFSVNVLFANPLVVSAPPDVCAAPVIRPDSFDDRTTLPLRRPPRSLI